MCQGIQLGQATQLQNLSIAVDLLAAYFPHTVCVFTLMSHEESTGRDVVAGEEGAVKRYRSISEDAATPGDMLYSHAILQEPDTVFHPDLKTDWRYSANPTVLKGLTSYLGVPVTLEVDPSDPNSRSATPARINIGTLNVYSTQPEPLLLSPTQTTVISHIVHVLESQLRATWEGNNRTIESKRRRIISEYMDKVLSEGFRPEKMDNNRPTARGDDSSKGDTVKEAAQLMIDMIRGVLPDLDTMLCVELKSLNYPVSSSLCLCSFATWDKTDDTSRTPSGHSQRHVHGQSYIHTHDPSHSMLPNDSITGTVHQSSGARQLSQQPQAGGEIQSRDGLVGSRGVPTTGNIFARYSHILRL